MHPKLERLLNKNSYFLTRGHDFVEIGGLKWATCNLGAEKPTDTGLFFQWGRTKGYTLEDALAKKCEFESCHDLPFSQELTCVNDIVKYYWGGRWRMPTAEELEVLSSGYMVKRKWVCNHLQTKANGILFRDGVNELFLPASGYLTDNFANYSFGHGGYYWTKSSRGDGTATDFAFIDSSNFAQYNDNKSLCFQIRPILDL